MPTYDYVCGVCGHRFEIAHGVFAEGPNECPNCGARALRKAIAAPAVHFKGSGWAKKERRSTVTSGASRTEGDAAARSDADGAARTDGDGAARTDAAGDKATTGEPSRERREERAADAATTGSGSASKTDAGRAARDTAGPKKPAAGRND